MPFLTIVTRTYKRPVLLERCKASIFSQTDQDIEHLILRDPVGVGVAKSNLLFLDAGPQGDYVMILDDDDLLARPSVVKDLRAVAGAHDPDVIVFKMDNRQLGILPGSVAWQQEPQHGFIGGSNIAVKRHVWEHCIWAIATDGQGGPPVYHSDLFYLEAVWAYTHRIYWMDQILVEVPRVRRGRME